MALDAIDILKEKYPDIFYLILFSESPFAMEYHDAEYERLKELVEAKDLTENVAKNIVSLPIHPNLNEIDLDKIIKFTNNFSE